MTGSAIFIIWIVGAILLYLADGWFNFSAKFEHREDTFLACVGWYVYLPIKLLIGIDIKVRKLKQIRMAKQQQEAKIRIAEQEEIKQCLAEYERELKENRVQ